MGLEYGGAWFLGGFLGGVVVAWNKILFTKVASRMGQFLVAVKLTRHSNDLEMIVVSIYGPTNVRRKTELWGELVKVVATFQGSPMPMGGDFNVTLEAMDRMNNSDGQDLDSKNFRSFITKAMLQEMGLVNYVYTCRSTNRNTMSSRLDRFLCLIELAEHFLLANVHLLLRPLSDHTPIVWMANESQMQSTYIKVNRSWVREVGFMEEVERAWSSQDHWSMGAPYGV